MEESRPMYLHEYHPKTELVVESHDVNYPKYPVIDIHGHYGGIYSDLWLEEFGLKKRPDIHSVVSMLRSCGIENAVNLDGFWDGFRGMTLEYVKKSLKPYNDFYITFVSVDTDRAVKPGFEEYVRAHLVKAKELGFKGIKLFKHVSIMVKDENGRYVPGRNISPDDDRFCVIWQLASELGLSVLIHIADPAAFFKSVDRFNERYEELLSHPDWQFGKSGMYTFDELMQAQVNLLSKNPDTTFIIAHAGSNPENLGFVAKCLDDHKNMYIDIAERINELGRQPYTARKFFVKYQDRILFGSDAFPWAMERRYPLYFKFLETWDEYFVQYSDRWKMYGIGLEDDILEKIYNKNAKKVLGI